MAASTYLNQVQQLYIAYFGRPADPAGQNFWAQVIDAEIGDISSVLKGFSTSGESVALYGTFSTTQQVTAIYANVFNRPAESAGLAFWVDQIASGKLTPAQAAWTIQQSAGSIDASAVSNKLIAANVFTSNVDTPAEIAAYSSPYAASIGRAFLNKVDATSASITNVATYAAIDVAIATGTAIAPPVTAPVVVPPSFSANVTAGIVTFSGTAVGDISVAWLGGVGAQATFSRGGILATPVTFGGANASSVSLAATETLTGSAATLIGLSVSGLGSVKLTDNSANLTAKSYIASTAHDILTITNAPSTLLNLSLMTGFETINLAGTSGGYIYLANGTGTIINASAAVSVGLGTGGQTFIGSSGNDYIETAAGININTLTGGAGVDSFVIGGGINTITDFSDGDNVIVAGGTVTANNVFSFVASGITYNNGSSNSAFTLKAAAAGSIINFSQAGGRVGVTIQGDAGIDHISGSLKADVFTGGAGADEFIFNASNRSTLAQLDTITDFRAAGGANSGAADIITISDINTASGFYTTVMAYNGTVASLADALQLAAAANTTNNGLSVFQWAGDEYLYIETTGSGNTYNAADTVIKLQGYPLAFGASTSGLGIDNV